VPIPPHALKDDLSIPIANVKVIERPPLCHPACPGLPWDRSVAKPRDLLCAYTPSKGPTSELANPPHPIRTNRAEAKLKARMRSPSKTEGHGFSRAENAAADEGFSP
jgi:hypothetical protein